MMGDVTAGPSRRSWRVEASPLKPYDGLPVDVVCCVFEGIG